MMDQEFLAELQYALLEPPDGGQSWPSEVWDRDDVLEAVNDATAATVRDTHCRTTYLEQIVLVGARSVSLPPDWLTTAHLVWRATPQQTRYGLIPTDAFEADSGLPGWEDTLGIPLGYADRDTNTLELRLVPSPIQDGILENLYVPVPVAITGNGVEVPVPELALSAVKYHALSTLLSGVHRLQDPERAAYCDERYQVATLALTLLLAGGA